MRLGRDGVLEVDGLPGDGGGGVVDPAEVEVALGDGANEGGKLGLHPVQVTVAAQRKCISHAYLLYPRFLRAGNLPVQARQEVCFCPGQEPVRLQRAGKQPAGARAGGRVNGEKREWAEGC